MSSVRATSSEATALVGGETRPLEAFKGSRVHAVAGIGNPQQFFARLQQLGLEVAPHALAGSCSADRRGHSISPMTLPVLMTEKDAVKCRAIADQRHWAVRMDVMVSEPDARRRSLIDACSASRTR